MTEAEKQMIKALASQVVWERLNNEPVLGVTESGRVKVGATHESPALDHWFNHVLKPVPQAGSPERPAWLGGE